jgi:hypothetical protein
LEEGKTKIPTIKNKNPAKELYKISDPLLLFLVWQLPLKKFHY